MLAKTTTNGAIVVATKTFPIPIAVFRSKVPGTGSSGGKKSKDQPVSGAQGGTSAPAGDLKREENDHEGEGRIALLSDSHKDAVRNRLILPRGGIWCTANVLWQLAVIPVCWLLHAPNKRI